MKAMASGKKAAKGGKRKVTHIRVTKAANGFTVHHELEPNKTRRPGGGMMPTYEADPKPSVFENKDAMLAHVGGLSDQMGGDEPGAPDASAAPATMPA